MGKVFLTLWILFLGFLSKADNQGRRGSDCERLKKAFISFDERESRITPPSKWRRKFSERFANKAQNLASMTTLYNEAENESDRDFIGEILGETLKGKEYRQIQMLKYETIYMMEDKECFEEEENMEYFAGSDGDCHVPSGGHPIGMGQKRFFGNVLDVVIHMDKSLYDEFHVANTDDRIKHLLGTTCLPKSLKEDEAGVDFFCERLRDNRDRKRQREEAFTDKYSVKKWLTDDHPYDLAPPGLVTGIFGLFQTGFDYWGTRMNIAQAYNMDSYYTDMSIFNEKFKRTNCIGQQSISNFKWNFLDNEGSPLSTDGHPVLPDLSNWDIQGAGNFSSCRRDHFVSPFQLSELGWGAPPTMPSQTLP
ncbi:MAG: hypothetical protein OXB88_06715 [Bacteriovoracales bacterium]|nr:hypothetical protein [Bacteriovoracales bacterium]